MLLREPEAAFGDPLAEMEWSRFPVKAMAKLGWIPDGPDLARRATEIIPDLIDRAGAPGQPDSWAECRITRSPSLVRAM